MRRPALFLALVLSAAAASGCGGGSTAKSPLDEGLGFLPKDAPFVAVIGTDLKSDQYRNIDRVLKKFPFGDQAKSAIRGSIEQNGLDFEKDVRPLLGNPFVVGAADPRAVTEQKNDNFVGAIEVKDGGKLNDLVDKEKARKVGDKDGYKVYRDDDGDFFAVKDKVLAVGGTRGSLEDAIAQRGKSDRLGEDEFRSATKDLPGGALVRASGNLKTLLSRDPGSAQARKVKWVDALRDFGLSASVEGDHATVDFRVSTDSGSVSDEDLPLASGADAPSVVQRPGELSVGLRDPSQVVEFAQRAAQSVDPSGYGDYERAKKQIDDRLHVNIDDDVIGQLTGEASTNVSVDGKFAFRAELKDPGEFKRTLKKAAPALPGFAQGALGGPARVSKHGDLYTLSRSGRSVELGVLNDVFVVSNEPSEAKRIANAKPRSVSGAEGSLVFTADAEKLANQVIQRLRPSIGPGEALGVGLFTGPLGDVTGSVRSDTSGLRGKLTLTLD